MEQDGASDTTFSLIERHRAGDAAALQALIERCYPRVERIVRVRLGSTLREYETVADVVQDVFVRVVEGLERFERRPGTQFIDWLARLAQNEISNHARSWGAAKRGGELRERVRTHAESVSTLDSPADSTGVHSKVSKRELIARVDSCLSVLTEPYREVILLRDYAGADWKTIAEQMNRPTPEACQELHRRARRELGRRVQGKTDFATGS